jgi:alkanesulfonate monooxygenase SsuD/methylene tetrahydromethanopterin reductase-like flavin-dependent oxidoreductase (luciferase family)
MRFCLSVPPFTDPGLVVRWARSAEAQGWDGFFLWDHLRWEGGFDLDVHDAWVLLGAIAAQTERIRIGTMITPLSRRRPWVVAKHLTTLDHLSGGRVTLGVGLGEPPRRDFADFGDEASPTMRAEMLDEALSVLGGLLGEGVARVRGRHYSVDADALPLPVQRPRIPIWVGGVAPHHRPLERARRWEGFVPIGYPFLTPEQLAAYVGAHPRPGWDVVAQWPDGTSPDDYAAAGATWLVRSGWPHDDGWRDELEALVSAPPA